MMTIDSKAIKPLDWGTVETFAEGVEIIMTTLYLTEQYSIVKMDGEALRVDMPDGEGSKNRGRVQRVALAKIDQVMVFGEITLTTPVLQTLMERRIGVHYLSPYGKSYGSLIADPGKNANLRLAQYQLHQDHTKRFGVARQVVGGKLLNMRTLLMRYARERENGEALRQAADQIRTEIRYLRDMQATETVDPADRMHGLGGLFGVEGQASQRYFGVFGQLLKGNWNFVGRLKRPPPDPVNALLSFGYVVLTNQVSSLVCAVGLDPAVGVLHQPGFGKPALALDLVEEFRAIIVDSVVITLLNTGQISRDDFEENPGTFRLRDEPRKTFLTKLEERLNTVIQHPLFGYKVSYRRCIELQARLFAKYAQGEIAEYVPFTVR